MDLVGHQIGSYVAKKLLGSGGMGAVYLCEHTMIDRKVAVKILHDEHAGDAEQIERFFAEARAAAAIGHPNIITIIDVGHLVTPAGPRAYVMMEALDGQSLDKRLSKGGLDLNQMRHVLQQCCDALATTHGKGIIHRDLKPANIFLCKQHFDPLFVKVLDFGIAKLTTPGAARKTQAGIVLGTPYYMSPEQCEGKGAVDHRSDIYSLGCMLYEMLTGTLPFDGEIRDILLAHITQDPEPPSRRNPAVPPAWEALCLRMMERAKEERPQSMTEVAAALGDLERHAADYEADKARRASSGKSGHTLVAASPLGASADGVPRPMIDATSRPTLHGKLEDLTGNASPQWTSGGYATGPVASTGHYAAPAGVGPVPHPVPDRYPTSIPTSGYVHGAPPPHGHPTPVGGYAPGYPQASGGYPQASGGYPQPSGGYPQPSGGYPQPTGGFPQASGGFAAVAPPTPPPMPGITPLQALTAYCEALATDPRYQRFVDFLYRMPRGDWADVRQLCAHAEVPPPPPGLELTAAWLEHPHDEPRFCSVVFFAPLTMWSTVIVRLRP